MTSNIAIGKRVLRELNNNGYQSYFVGGIVRNIILGKTINDIDIATDAFPDKVMEIFKECKPTGLKHGTVTVILDNIPIEVTTFRSDGKYDDFRHPNDVRFVSSIDEDLSRRDFTINAIAMDINDQIVDPFGGKVAIYKKMIKAVGDPKERFFEDPLRMLRAIRFVAQLNFSINEATWKKLRLNSSYIQFISNERVKKELDKIMKAEYTDIAIKLFYKSNLINWVKGLNTTKLPYLDSEGLAKLIKKTDDFYTRWFLFLYLIDNNERQLVMDLLKFTNNEKQMMNNINYAYQLLDKELSEIIIKQCLIETNYEICLKSINILTIINKINESDRSFWIDKLKELDKKIKVRSINDLDINGKDLMLAFGFEEGSWLKQLLQELFIKVAYEGLPNKKSRLIEQAFLIRGEEKDEG